MAASVKAAGVSSVTFYEQFADKRDCALAAVAERLDVDWVRSAGILAPIGKLVMAGEPERLPELASELAAALSTR